MKLNNYYLWIIITCIGLISTIPFLKREKLEVVFCDVGQGDGILVKYKSFQAVIDGGPSRQAILECLSREMPFWDQQIDLVILTHSDSDHITGLISVLERYNVSQIVVNSISKESNLFWQFHQAVRGEEAVIYSPRAGDKIMLGQVVLEILWPKEKLGDQRIWQLAGEKEVAQVLGATTVEKEANETSVVTKLSYGLFDVLLAGDIGFDTEEQIDFPEVEVLKIPHHGSRYSTSQDLLEESSPETAIISVGKNHFGHPTKEVIGKLENKGINIYRTDKDGSIKVTSNGESWRIKPIK